MALPNETFISIGLVYSVEPGWHQFISCLRSEKVINILKVWKLGTLRCLENLKASSGDVGHLIAKRSVRISGFGVCVENLCWFSLEGFYAQTKTCSLFWLENLNYPYVLPGDSWETIQHHQWPWSEGEWMVFHIPKDTNAVFLFCCGLLRNTEFKIIIKWDFAGSLEMTQTHWKPSTNAPTNLKIPSGELASVTSRPTAEVQAF